MTQVIQHTQPTTNELFPVFLKANELEVLLVGGGNVALEKATALLGNAPETKLTVVAPLIKDELKLFLDGFEFVELLEKRFEPTDLDGKQLAIVAIDDVVESAKIKESASQRGVLTNVADTPQLCDFYLGSIVKKGNVKLAISTNGKSPTLAKRVRELLQESIPEEIDQSAENLNNIREQLKGDFDYKVKTLNELTLNGKATATKKVGVWTLRSKQVKWILPLIFMLTVVTSLVLLFGPAHVGNYLQMLNEQTGGKLPYFFLAGFIAQMIDGAFGMAYGVTTTSFLLSMGVPPATASASMHAAEIFASGSASYFYFKLKQINMKLFKTLALGGVLGAMSGAIFLGLTGSKITFIKPFVAAYCVLLGVIVIRKAIKPRTTEKQKSRRVGWLGYFGGIIDSIGGGGWGPFVTSTLVARGRDLKITVGSAHLAKFLVAIASTLTFFTVIGFSHLPIIGALIAGSILASPISLWVATNISKRTGLLVVGGFVIIISLRTLFLSIL